METKADPRTVEDRCQDLLDWLKMRPDLKAKTISVTEDEAKVCFFRECIEAFRKEFHGCKYVRHLAGYGSQWLTVEEDGVMYECWEPNRPDKEEGVL